MSEVWLIIIVVVGIFIGSAISFSSAASKFAKIGDVTNKSLEEIITLVGSPNSIDGQADGTVLYQWIKTSQFGGYHYAMLFKDNKCLGYTHQFVT